MKVLECIKKEIVERLRNPANCRSNEKLSTRLENIMKKYLSELLFY